MALKVKIDGRETEVEQGTTVLQAASKVGVHVPHLCYHSELSVAGSCRVCLVEIEGTPKLQPACSTVVCEGMVVRTDSPAVSEARRGVLELLAINHPLDCPVCDKGGECKLQDYVFAYGAGRGRFAFEKRTYGKEDIGPFVVRDMNRCIHCTRCVRFTQQVSLSEDMGAFGRGDKTSIGTCAGRELRNPFSGNVTELCPVGALTDRIFRFRARVWELEKVPSACPVCPVGCPTWLQLDSGRIVRILGREGGSSPWLCDMGRFGFAAETSGQRRPFIRENGREVDVPWEVALGMVTGRFRVISRESGPGSVGVLCSALSTNEELFGIQYVFRNLLKSNNIDFRVRSAAPVTQEEADVLSTALGVQGELKEIEDCDTVFLLCSDPCEEIPVMGLHVGRAVASGGKVVAVGPRRASPRRLSGNWLPATPEQSILLFASLSRELGLRALGTGAQPSDSLKGLEELRHFSLEDACENAGVETGKLRSVADELLSAKKLGLVVGAEVFETRFVYVVLSSMLRIRAARKILGKGETILLSSLGEHNVRGALELGAFPAYHRAAGGPRSAGGQPDSTAGSEGRPPRATPGEATSGDDASRGSDAVAIGMSTDQMIEAAGSGKLRALLVFGCDPLSEYVDRKAVSEALGKVEFLVVQSESVNATAGLSHVYIPLQSIFEREGTIVTVDGTLRALTPQESQPGKRSLLFDVLDSLSQTMGEGLSFRDAGSTFREMRRLHDWDCPEELKQLASSSGIQIRKRKTETDGFWIAARSFEKNAGPSGADSTSPDYPMALVTGPVRVSSWAWARQFSEHELVPKDDFAEIPASDARALGIADGDTIEIESPGGSVRVRAVVTDSLMSGTVFLPRGLAEARVNLLTSGGEGPTKVKLRKTSA